MSEKLTNLTEISTLAIDDQMYIVDKSDTTDSAAGSSRRVQVDRVGGFVNPAICNGRLTLETGVPISTADQTGKTSVFFTPYKGNRIAVYDGTRWELYTFSELTLSLGTLTAAKNYDIFIYDNSGTLTLEVSAAWTNASTRADALALQDGIYVKSGTTTRRYLGTFYTTSTTTTEDSQAKRNLYNLYNQAQRPLRITDATDSWTYNSTTWRSANNSTANRVEVVVGLSGQMIDLTIINYATQSSTLDNGSIAIGEDSTSSPHANNIGQYMPGVVQPAAAMALCKILPATGFHFYQWIERTLALGTGMTFYGDAGVPGFLTSGISGAMLM